MERTWMPIDRWMDKDTAHTYNGIILTHKKNKVVPFTETPMGLETVIQSEKSERPKKNKVY